MSSPIIKCEKASFITHKSINGAQASDLNTENTTYTIDNVTMQSSKVMGY
jgi:hypothetical protein